MSDKESQGSYHNAAGLPEVKVYDGPDGGHGTNDRPWIHNLATNTIYVGPVNGFHDDVLHQQMEDQGLDAWQQGNAAGRTGDAFMNLNHAHPRRKLIQQALVGAGFGIPDDDGEFHFASDWDGYRKALEMGWTPGNQGSGLVFDDGVHTWNRNGHNLSLGVDIHHGDINRELGRQGGFPIYIRPDGHVSGHDAYVPEQYHEAIQAKHPETTFSNGWHFASAAGEPMAYHNAGWEDTSWNEPPEGIDYWNPGQLGKGIVDVNGRAHAWSIDENHGTDGYPAHAEYAEAAQIKPRSYYTVFHDGTFEPIGSSNPQDYEIMKAHLPQEPRCAGCGTKVAPDKEGYYKCPRCRWQGQYGDQVPEDGGFHFASALEEPMPYHNSGSPMVPDGPQFAAPEAGLPWKALTLQDGRQYAWYVDALSGDPHHSQAISVIPDPQIEDFHDGQRWEEPEPSGWHFASGLNNVPWVAGEDELTPWEPGRAGKGMIFGGKPTTWITTDQWGGPHHEEAAFHLDPEENTPIDGYFHIHPDGAVELEGGQPEDREHRMQRFLAHDPRLHEFDPEGFHFASDGDPGTPALNGGPLPGQGPLVETNVGSTSNFHSDDKPIIYNPHYSEDGKTSRGKVYVGRHGAYHWDMILDHPELEDWYRRYDEDENPMPIDTYFAPSDVEDELHYGRLGEGRDGRAIEWHNRPEDAERVHQALGIQEMDPDDFHFASGHVPVIEHEEPEGWRDEMGFGNDGIGIGRPFLYNQHEVHLGWPGASHQEVTDYSGADDETHEAGYYNDIGQVGFFGRKGPVEDAAQAAIQQHLGQGSREDGWHFEGSAPVYSEAMPGPTPVAPVRWAPARSLEPYLEHDGTINDEELGGGAYLQQMAEAGVYADEHNPIVLGIQEDGSASIYDGNHRLLLALKDNPDAPVPYVVRRVDDSTFPGVPYDGKLGSVTPSEGWRFASDYRGQHTAPGPEYGAPMHDMTQGGILPEDVYTHPHHYYFDREYDPKSLAHAISMRGRPDAPVDIYRAAPAGELNPGDWVTANAAYAKRHGLHHDDPAQDMPVWKYTVPASSLWTNGDSYSEWGYHGPAQRAATPHTGHKEASGDSEPETSWHLTDNENFALDPAYHPENNTTLGGDWPHAGIFLTKDPERWFNGHDYVRPFAAEIEHPPLSNFGGYSGENFLPSEGFPHSQVRRVIPWDEYCREQYGDTGHFEDYHGDGRPPSPRGGGYRYEGPDVREMAPEEIARLKQRTHEYIQGNRPHMLADPYDEGHQSSVTSAKRPIQWAGDPSSADPKEMGLHPVVVYPDRILVGHDGLHHSDIAPDRRHDDGSAAAVAVVKPTNPTWQQGTVSWLSPPPNNHEQIVQQIGEHLGVPMKPEDTFSGPHFAATFPAYCLTCNDNTTKEELPDGGSRCTQCGTQAPPFKPKAKEDDYDPKTNAEISCPNCQPQLTPTQQIDGNIWSFPPQTNYNPDSNCPTCHGVGHIPAPRNTDGYRAPAINWNLEHITLPEGAQPHFGSGGWHIQESDFDPANTFFPSDGDNPMGNPSRDDQRVVVAHLPTRQVFVGQRGTHHADLVHHHELDSEAISDLPRDERQYYDRVEENPYHWTSEEGPGNFPSLHYGWINDRGGYARVGHKPEGLTEALHAHGLLQQPDGSVHTQVPEGEWHFAMAPGVQVPDLSKAKGLGRYHGLAHPWTLGEEGKGLVLPDGQAYLWRAGSQSSDPHHPDVLAHLDPSYGGNFGLRERIKGAYEILPDGKVVDSIWGQHDREGFAALHPDLHTGEEEFHFAHGDDFQWPYSEPHAQLHFPEGFEHSDRDRTPFIWTVHDQDPNEVHVYVGHPGSEHAGITAPSHRVWSYQDQAEYEQPSMHPRLERAAQEGSERIGGYGSVKPPSWFGQEGPSRMELYDVPEPHTIGAVADVIHAHQPFGLPADHGYQAYDKVHPNYDEGDDFYFEGKVAAETPQVIKFQEGEIPYHDEHRAKYGPPVIYNRSTNQVAVGPAGVHHADLFARLPRWHNRDCYQGSIHPRDVSAVGGDTYKPGLEWYRTPPWPDEHEQISQALGVTTVDPDSYHFATIAPTCPQVKGALPWKPGEYGKAYVALDGTPYLWTSADFHSNMVHHSHVIERHDLEGDNTEGAERPSQRSFHVKPSGAVEGANWTFDPAARDLLVKSHPALNYSLDEEEPSFDFAARVAGYFARPETPEEQWSGLELHDGTMHTWPTMGERGHIAHAQYMIDNQIHPSTVKNYAYWNRGERTWEPLNKYRNDYNKIYETGMQRRNDDSWHFEGSSDWDLTRVAVNWDRWNPLVYHNEPPKPDPYQVEPGTMCDVHPTEPAVMADGFRKMCANCANAWETKTPPTPWPLPAQ